MLSVLSLKLYKKQFLIPGDRLSRKKCVCGLPRGASRRLECSNSRAYETVKLDWTWNQTVFKFCLGPLVI